jgi:hypothetical protein
VAYEGTPLINLGTMKMMLTSIFAILTGYYDIDSQRGRLDGEGGVGGDGPTKHNTYVI